MHLTTSIWPALLLASSALAQNQRQSTCITNCETNHLESSTCNGDETGQALADCTCASYQGPTDPLIVCVKSCSAADVAQFAANIPAECRAKLFPQITVAPGSGAAVLTKTESETSASATTTSESATGGMTTGAAATGTTTQATTTTTPAAAASSTHAGLAAVNQPAEMVMAIGVLAAFAI